MSMALFCVEDAVSRSVIKRLFREYCGAAASLKEMLEKRSGGIGKMRAEKNFKKFFGSAKRDVIVVLLDSDNHECPPSLRGHWIDNIWRQNFPEKMIFCMAEVEVESWLLAD